MLLAFQDLVSLSLPRQEQAQSEIDEEDSRPLMSDMGASPQLRADEIGARDIKKKLAAAGPIHDRLMAEYSKIPKFTPPANNHLTEKQVLALHDVYMIGVLAARNFQIYDLGKSPRFFKAVASYAYLPALIENAKMEGLVKNQMTMEEMDWILQREMEAALFASNLKWNAGQGTPEERQRLKRVRNGMAFILGLKEEKKYEEGGLFYYPERLDSSKIPRANLALFLKLKDQVDWVEVHFDQITFNEAQILEAAKALPD